MHPKRRLRTSAAHAGQAEGGWAVSYADFLMVLLSFFIVFFSFDEKSSLHNIVVSLAQHSSPVVANLGAGEGGTAKAGNIGIGNIGNGGGPGTGTGGYGNDVLTRVSSIFKDSKIEAFATKERIVVDLPNDIYRAGAYQVPEQDLSAILSALAPYQSEISITIMGHADGTVFQHSRKVVKDNLTLASLRAAYASTHVQQILPKAQVWIQASEHSARKTRSLSFVIEPRKGGTL
jgi:flagellar motor protein MotB